MYLSLSVCLTDSIKQKASLAFWRQNCSLLLRRAFNISDPRTSYVQKLTHKIPLPVIINSTPHNCKKIPLSQGGPPPWELQLHIPGQIPWSPQCMQVQEYLGPSGKSSAVGGGLLWVGGWFGLVAVIESLL